MKYYILTTRPADEGRPEKILTKLEIGKRFFDFCMRCFFYFPNNDVKPEDKGGKE
ncbi:MAG: hypothetical protein GY774_35590 [Planctomycetes bacterium]|nr:hypothetical protein [Planctomycetota bacterium]